MASGTRSDQLIVIVGPTASGKSDVAMNIARHHNGEIICADSRTVYQGLDIGTAKPTLKDREEIPHHLLDVVAPDETFSAAQFQRLANQAIDDIKSREKLPILVGGTGLFVDGVLFDYKFADAVDPVFRAKLEAMSTEELQNYCSKYNIPLPENRLNKRHLVRTIERGGANRKRSDQVRSDALVVGIFPGKEILQQRILKRAEKMFTPSVINETTDIADGYGWDAPGLSGNIYPIIRRLVVKEITLHEAISLFATADWQLARRQLTWFRRNQAIKWCESVEEAEQLIESHLANLL